MTAALKRPVVQQEPTGCALACAAMLAGLTYNQARQSAKALGISAGDAALWSSTRPLRRLLAQLNIKVAGKETPFTSWDALPDCALLAIKWHVENGVPFWHWVLFSRDGGDPCVLDPKKALKTNRRTDFGRMRPRWFIQVHR